MVAPIIAALGGAALRMGGTRLAAGAAAGGAEGGAAAGGSMGGRFMAGNAMKFGGEALGKSAQRPQRQDHGMSQWAKENPGEATMAGVAGAVRAMSSPGLSSAAASQFQSVISPMQFGK